MVCEIPGRPVQYKQNKLYLRWRRVKQIREQYSDEEIVEALSETLETVAEYRERFDADTSDEVSMMDANHEGRLRRRGKHCLIGRHLSSV